MKECAMQSNLHSNALHCRHTLRDDWTAFLKLTTHVTILNCTYTYKYLSSCDLASFAIERNKMEKASRARGMPYRRYFSCTEVKGN